MMRPVKLCGETLSESGHVCAFFDSREEKYATLAPFFKETLDAGDQVVNVVEAAAFDAHLRALSDASVPVEAARSREQLRVLTAEDTYLRDGKMQLEAMLQMLGETLSAARDAKRGVRTCGEMDWIGRAGVDPEQVLEYEARVNDFIPDFDCTLLCVYDLAKTPAEMISDILVTHSYAIVRGRLRPNPYFVNPEEYLEMLRARRASVTEPRSSE